MTDPLLGHMVAGGTALAGFTLVFLGILQASYESFDADQRTSVQARYRLRGYLAFLGFLAALVGALAALAGSAGVAGPFRTVAIWALVVSLAFVISAAVTLVGDFN